jgi:hypothetical protein
VCVELFVLKLQGVGPERKLPTEVDGSAHSVSWQSGGMHTLLWLLFIWNDHVHEKNPHWKP